MRPGKSPSRTVASNGENPEGQTGTTTVDESSDGFVALDRDEVGAGAGATETDDESSDGVVAFDRDVVGAGADGTVTGSLAAAAAVASGAETGGGTCAGRFRLPPPCGVLTRPCGERFPLLSL